MEEWALCQDQGEDSTTRQGRQPLHNHCCGSGSDQNRPDPDPTQKMEERNDRANNKNRYFLTHYTLKHIVTKKCF